MNEYIKLLGKETLMLRDELDKLEKKISENDKIIMDKFSKIQNFTHEIETLNTNFSDAKINCILPYCIASVLLISVIAFVISNNIGNNIFVSFFNYAICSGFILGIGELIFYKLIEEKIERFLLKRFPSLKAKFSNIKNKEKELENTEKDFDIARKNEDIFKSELVMVEKAYESKKEMLENAKRYYNDTININNVSKKSKTRKKIKSNNGIYS